MEKEIGGYFGLETFNGREYYEHLLGVNSGRNALLYILKAKAVKKLYIPYFLCDSVSLLCGREGIEYGYYNVDRQLRPAFPKELGEEEWLYIVNFYGQISNAEAMEMKNRWNRIIFDNVQAFFQKPVPGIDTVYSCRKFFGVPDGGYVSTDARLPEPLETDVSGGRMKHVLGRFEGRASDYYGDFRSNDERFEQLPLRSMSPLTRNILKAVDYEAVRRKRNENYAWLERSLGQYNKMSFSEPDGPYCYPFCCPNGMAVKKELAKKKIYVATLWPNVLEFPDIWEREPAENILPLPCDQRYSAADMEYMVREIMTLLGIR